MTARARVESERDDPEAIRALAHLYQANRLFSEAKACYLSLAKMPSGLLAPDHYLLADIAQNSGELGSAVTELRRTVEMEPSYMPARIALADTLFKSGDEDGAALQYLQVLKMDPQHPQASLGMARLELQRDNDAAAVSRLESLLAVHPEFTSGVALLAQVLGRLGQKERAAALSEWSRQKREPIPPDPWLDALLADCYDGQRLALKFEEFLYSGQMEAALPLLDRVEQLDAKSWTPHLLKGWSHAKLGRHREALDHFTTALSKGGDPERIGPLMVTSLLASNDAAAATKVAEDLANQRPDSVPLLTAASELAVRRGDVPRAKLLLTDILIKEPYLYSQNLSLAKILWDAGERDAAVKCLARIMTVYPVDVASRGLVGQYYLEKGEPRGAIAPLEQAIPHAAEGTPARQRLVEMLDAAYLQTAMAESDSGHFEEARRLFDKAAQLRPNNLNAWLGQANASVQLREWSPASAALERLSTAQPENPTIQLSWGDVLYQSGQHDRARQAWQQALALTPVGDAELRGVLERRLTGPISPETFE